MATPTEFHDHAGWRWLAPFGAAFLITLATALTMMVYPYLAR